MEGPLPVMLQDGVPRDRLRSSWGGAMGLTQFLPSEFYKYAVDFDGDGRVDIWTLGSRMRSPRPPSSCVGKGWQRGRRWAYEVRVPADVDCTIGVARHSADRRMAAAGLAPAYGRKLRRTSCTSRLRCCMPAGLYGPAFLTPKNYFVIKDYNFSDLYVLFVGHLATACRMRGRSRRRGARWHSCRPRDVERMQQQADRARPLHDKIDGKAGMQTRAALGAYQKANGLKIDCWPTAEVLTHMQGRR